MSPALREAIREGDGVGRLEPDAVGMPVGTGRGAHPVCGDEIEVDVRLADGRVADLAFRARGCPATLAVAAVLRRALHGSDPRLAPERLGRCLQSLGGLARHERHAERIALEAFGGAVAALSGDGA